MHPIRFLINDWLLRQAGKILMITGGIGIILDWRYDRIVGRALEAYYFGPMQWICLCWCVFLIYVGFVFNDFMKTIR